MSKSKPKPNNGKEPYLFISYARIDSETVLPIIKHLQSLGVRVWYDEGIDPGARNFEKRIADAIKNCDIFVAMLTKNYYESDYCVGEIRDARRNDKRIVNIFLKDDRMPDDLYILFCTYQGIELFKMLEEEFDEKIMQVQEIINCIDPEKISELFHIPVPRPDDTPFSFDMKHSGSFCIDDQDNDGCRIIKRESSSNNVTIAVDFSQTSSKLSSVVFFNEKNLYGHAQKKMSLCFEASSVPDVPAADIELLFGKNNICLEEMISLNGEEQEFKIPLEEFAAVPLSWKSVPEIKFLFRRRHFSSPVTINIRNLRIE